MTEAFQSLLCPVKVSLRAANKRSTVCKVGFKHLLTKWCFSFFYSLFKILFFSSDFDTELHARSKTHVMFCRPNYTAVDFLKKYLWTTNFPFPLLFSSLQDLTNTYFSHSRKCSSIFFLYFFLFVAYRMFSKAKYVIYF